MEASTDGVADLGGLELLIGTISISTAGLGAGVIESAISSEE